jgi:hypothetical protein
MRMIESRYPEVSGSGSDLLEASGRGLSQSGVGTRVNAATSISAVRALTPAVRRQRAFSIVGAGRDADGCAAGE